MRVQVLVNNRIVMWTSELGEELVDELKASFTHVNPQREMLRRIGKPHWGEPATIETWGEEAGRLTLPRGGMVRVRAALAKHGLAREVVDEREQGDVAGADMPDHLVDLHPFQEDAVAEMIRKECGIIRAPTGSGKTCLAFGVAARVKAATLVIVYNAGLFDQWVARATRELGLHENDIGIIRASKCKLRPFTIAMQQTLSAHGVDDRLKQYFGMVLVDEVHRAAARTMFAAVDPFPARYRIGISADHRRKDGKEFITKDLFGEVIDDVKRKDLIESGHVLEVQIRVVPTDFEADWYGMPSDERPRAELNVVRLNKEIGDDYARNERGLTWVLKETDLAEQVLVFSHTREHCLVLDQRLVSLGVRTGFLIGGDDYKVEFRKTVAGLEGGTVRVGVGTFQAIGQGIDLPSVAVGVCMTPIASNRQVFNQVRGRFCRTAIGKKGARLYYLWDRNVFGKKHLANLVSWNTDVVVYEDGAWVNGREYLARLGS